MSSLLKRVPLLAGVVLLAWSCKGLGFRKEFEGKVVYGASLTGPNAEMLSPLLKAQQASFAVYHKKDYMRLEESGRAILVDYQRDSITFLFTGDQKYYTTSFDEVRKDQKASSSVERLAEEREILGHSCTGYRVISDEGDTLIYWEAKDLALSPEASQLYLLAPPGLALKGVLLGVESPVRGTPLRLVQQAEKIETDKVEDALFQVPVGYTHIKK